jgi:hypothetical protein
MCTGFFFFFEVECCLVPLRIVRGKSFNESVQGTQTFDFNSLPHRRYAGHADGTFRR